MKTTAMSLFTDNFSKLVIWSENEKRHVIKSNSLTVFNVKATIEHRADTGYCLCYSSKNLNYSARSSPIISLEKSIDKLGNNEYIISTATDTKDTMYYKLTI